ncbi:MULTISPECIES: DNA polymerase III subunit delta [Bacteroides]|uniref:DNA polymerase III subunit delta n=1 Tax=Bacteroides TaxID=816 RepID=UPI001E01D999|nr:MULTISPECIES: DNA polymerase III subunit delta [Bacteroides]HJD91268.1 DNA polymerase III subunit delta [Bacteroides coprosuis]
MAKKEQSFESIMKDIRAKKYAPVYYLMGEESYYIDLISDTLEENVLTEEEKEFNLTVLYGADIDVSTIINAAKRYPMMSEHQVVIVKEAQQIRNMDQLSYYLQKPLLSTILVICHKHGKLDGRKKLGSEIAKIGVLFESKALKDRDLIGFIDSYIQRKQFTIEPKASAMLADFIGADLSRLTSELDKLILTTGGKQKRITPDLVEKNIGISKSYNNFELRNALLDRDVFRVNQIVHYFEENPKTNPLPMTLGLLFSYFSNLMLAYYSPDKSDRGIAEMLSLRTPWQAKDYIKGMNTFSGVKTMDIIGYIRETDAMSKGIGNSHMSDGDLLKELVYKILH